MSPHNSITVEVKQKLAFKHFNERKTKDVVRQNTRRPCLTTLEPSDRVLIHNLSETEVEQARWEATGKRKSILYLVLVMTLPFTK